MELRRACISRIINWRCGIVFPSSFNRINEISLQFQLRSNSYQHYSIIFPNEGRSSHYNMQHYLNYKVALNYNFVYYLIEPWSIRPIPHLHRRAGILLIRGGVYTGMYS